MINLPFSLNGRPQTLNLQHSSLSKSSLSQQPQHARYKSRQKNDSQPVRQIANAIKHSRIYCAGIPDSIQIKFDPDSIQICPCKRGLDDEFGSGCALMMAFVHAMTVTVMYRSNTQCATIHVQLGCMEVTMKTETKQSQNVHIIIVPHSDAYLTSLCHLTLNHMSYS